MILGPMFHREAVLAPQRPKLYLARTVYVAVVLIVMCTAWQFVAGTQIIRNVGDMARFGAVLFQILAPCNWPWSPSPRPWCPPVRWLRRRTVAR